MKKIIIVSGPTASGKTSTSINIALQLNQNGHKAEIVNYDSLLFYKEMNIGTAKPTEEEKLGIPHHMVDICLPSEALNAADYAKQATEIINNLHAKKIIPIVVGGSPFYIRALIKGMIETTKEVPSSLKDKHQKLLEEQGIGVFINYLKKYDPESLEVLHGNDHYRLVRAVEFHKTQGQKISEHKKITEELKPYDFSINTANPTWDCFHIFLDLPKDEHQKIIEKRTEEMITEGLEEETQKLLINYKDAKALSSIGYKEMIQFISGHFENINDCKERIIISTRQLAKSQRTFYKKITPKFTYHPLKDKIKLIEDINSFITNGESSESKS